MTVSRKTNRAKRILLVNPWIYDFAAYDFWIKPLGLLTLGAILRQNGFTVNVIDCLNPRHAVESVAETERRPRRTALGTGEFLKTPIPKPAMFAEFPRRYSRYGISVPAFRSALGTLSPPDLVLIGSMMTYWYPGAFAAIRQIKSAFPGVPVAFGGNYVTLCPDHAALSGADRLITGPGEAALPTLCRDFLDEDISFAPSPGEFDDYPYPAFDLLPQNDQIPILTSRGCPFDCTYCASRILNPFFVRRSPERVVEEIEFWYKQYGIMNFSFYDDALLIRPEEMFVPLATELIRRKLPCRFHCPNGLHLREVSPEIATLLFRAGFQTIRFGFETSDRQRQYATGGKVKNSELETAVTCLKKAGYQDRDIGVYLLCGLPNQEAAEVRKSIAYVYDCGARPIIAEYSPIPGTALWKEAVAASPFPLADEPLYHNNTLLPCRSDRMDYAMYRSLKMLTRLGSQKG
ncbi:MAG: cobalamin-dependent protein [Syntrophaceae bacterium]|nr:cobalamin-dependent protein [Syntrophaceae bacterium]